MRNWWEIIRRGVLVVGAALSFFAVIEVIRAYETLSGLHWLVGYVFLAGVGAGLLWLLYYVVKGVMLRSAVLRVPKIHDVNEASPFLPVRPPQEPRAVGGTVGGAQRRHRGGGGDVPILPESSPGRDRGDAGSDRRTFRKDLPSRIDLMGSGDSRGYPR